MKKYHEQQVCTDPNNPGHPEPFQTDTSCPSHCLKDRTLNFFENGTNGDFYIDKKGHLIVTKTAAFQVSNLHPLPIIIVYLYLYLNKSTLICVLLCLYINLFFRI